MTLEHSLTNLETSGIIRLAQMEPELEYLFRHALVQEVTYESMLRGDRRRLHLTIGETIERLFPERLDEFAPLLSHHFLQSENYDKALKYSLLAAEKAIQQYANEEAIIHLISGISVLENLSKEINRDRIEVILLTMLGSAHVATKGAGSELVFQTFSRALEICDRRQMHARVFPIQIGLIGYYSARARVEEARIMAKKAFEFSLKHPVPFVTSWAYWFLGITLFQSGELASAREELGRAAQSPRLPYLISAIQDGRVNSLGLYAHVLVLLGYFDQSLDAIQKGMRLAEEINQPLSLVDIYWNSAVAYWARGDLQNTKKWAEALICLSKEHGFRYHETLGTMFQGWVLGKQGNIEKGVAQIQDGLKKTRDIPILMFRSYHLSLLADVYIEAGKFEAGLDVVNQTLAFVEDSGERFYQAEIYRMKGELLVSLGRDEGEKWFQKAIEAARNQQARSLELRATMSLCRLLEKQGNREEARQRLAEIYNWFTEGLDTPDLQNARKLLASLGN